MDRLRRSGRFLALLCLLAVAPGVGADQSANDLRDEVRRLREDLSALQQEFRDFKQTLTPRRTGTGWEKVDGLTLNPEDSPQRGAPEASLVLIEFSDYQCPYCARHFADTLPQIERDFIAPGKLRYIVAEYPLEQMHPLAVKAAVAARCAGDQGRFWDMHARLFTNQRQLEPWSAHAEALGLDSARFESCLQNRTYAAQVRTNAAEAQRAGVKSTPTFLLAFAAGSEVHVVRRLRGAAPYQAFKAEIEALLTETNQAPQPSR